MTQVFQESYSTLGSLKQASINLHRLVRRHYALILTGQQRQRKVMLDEAFTALLSIEKLVIGKGI